MRRRIARFVVLSCLAVGLVGCWIHSIRPVRE